jgi:hypothetical protein
MLMTAVGGPEVFKLVEQPAPEISGEHDVRVRLRAAGINPVDYELRERARVRRDQFVLVQAGAGGGGHMAVQIARLAGARVASTVTPGPTSRARGCRRRSRRCTTAICASLRLDARAIGVLVVGASRAPAEGPRAGSYPLRRRRVADCGRCDVSSRVGSGCAPRARSERDRGKGCSHIRMRENGRGEIRTPETGVARLPVFKTGAFNRSATLPGQAEG